MGKRELVALLSLSSWCLMIVVWFFLAVPWVCLQFVMMVFPDHTHYFWTKVTRFMSTVFFFFFFFFFGGGGEGGVFLPEYDIPLTFCSNEVEETKMHAVICQLLLAIKERNKILQTKSSHFTTYSVLAWCNKRILAGYSQNSLFKPC